MRKTKPYHDYLLGSLQDPEEAAEYLNAVLEESDPKLFLAALRDVADAYGMGEIAKKTDLNRPSLYRMLSKEGNPEIYSVFSLLSAIGLKLKTKAA
ncbi:MAG: putative addiction module antidote protein [Deltaproteobacteria bacterium]|nr:putative addiction module antidote protein [Deltaproteobacteria bacterium]